MVERISRGAMSAYPDDFGESVTRLKRLVVFNHLFELAVAVAFVLYGVAIYVNPGNTTVHSQIGKDFGVWQYAWATMYIVAGPAMVYGIFRRQINHRVAGLIIFGSAAVMQGVAALASGAVEPRDFSYFIYAAAASARIYDIYRCHNGRKS